MRRRARLEDPGAELLGHFGSLWERYGRVTLMVLGGLVAVGMVLFLMWRGRAAAEDQAAGRLGEASILYWQGDYARSLELAKQVGQQFPNAPSGLDAHRLAADAAYWQGDFKTAVAEYRTYLAHAKRGILADAARRSMAYALESAGQYQEAGSLYDQLVGTFDRESSAEFLAAAARCERAAGRRPEAAKHLQRLVDEFGETSFADLARVQLAELSSATH